MGHSVLAASRYPEKSRATFAEVLKKYPRRLELISVDFDGTTPPRELFAGLDGLFLMRPPQVGDVESLMFPFLRQAAEAGVPYVVLLSLLGAQWMPFVPHRKLEKEIARLGLPHTFMRAGFFMQNLDTVFREFIRQENELPVPAGSSRTSFVDARDLGEAAAKLLASEESPPAAVELTGEKRYTYYDVARELSEELGRRITYAAPGSREFERRALAAGWNPEYAKVVSRLFLTVRLGLAQKVTGDARALLGRPPRSLEQYITDYRDVWLR
jgi:uncharacterized protein YbjT (DUF2867 family)